MVAVEKSAEALANGRFLPGTVFVFSAPEIFRQNTKGSLGLYKAYKLVT